ncbi:MAG TPA: DUF5995 family protein [Myxococcaceae bacterium]|nr:DUF5995 family protein [Myxococcaceae bacterium]
MTDIQVSAPRRVHVPRQLPAEESGQVTEVPQLARFRPCNTDEALVCLRRALEFFYERQDDRAIFLRAYYVMTTEVNAAVHVRGDFTRQIFFDPEWVDQLAGKFARLYFESLAEPDGGTVARAWRRAHDFACNERGSIILNLLLGINAHINYDLSCSLYENFRQYEDHRDHLLLSRRKFDHDQINNLLVRSNPKIQQCLTRDFGGGMRFFSSLAGTLDELLTITGLKHYRERVWWDSLSFLATEDEPERDLVRERLSWEAGKVADFITSRNALHLSVRGLDGLLRRRRFGALTLEGPGGIHADRDFGRKMQLPFGTA